MKTLRLFIDQDLNAPINWIMVDDDGSSETGNSTFSEIATFGQATVEVYLAVRCCSIFKTNIQGISTKRLTEELVLGLLEESIVDDIDDVKPIILHAQDTEQDSVYVAVFNREYYDALISNITSLNKPIRFIQSFAFATQFSENSWTVFLSENSSFVRTSKFEFYALDNSQPLPALLVDLLNTQKPSQIVAYADRETYDKLSELSTHYGITCTNISEDLEYGFPVWNFYNPKTSNFKITLDKTTKENLTRLLFVTKYLAIFLFIVWIFNIIELNIANNILQNKIKKRLAPIVNTNNIGEKMIKDAEAQITELRHQRSLYDDTDAVVIFRKFLEIVSAINHNDIKQIKFSHGILTIVLGSHFDASNFTNYANILATKDIDADIYDYKNYAKMQKSNSNTNSNTLDAQDDKLIDDAAWVVTLRPELMSKAQLKLINQNQ